VDLADAADREDSQHTVELDSRPGFLPGFADGALLKGLSELEKACRQSPQAVARLDRAAAKQHAIVGNDHGTDNDLRVLVRDVSAINADHALMVIVFRDAANEPGHARRVTCLPGRVSVRMDGAACAADQTDRSSNEPRGMTRPDGGAPNTPPDDPEDDDCGGGGAACLGWTPATRTG
jgi:hypothetical protein